MFVHWDINLVIAFDPPPVYSYINILIYAYMYACKSFQVSLLA